jgi:hypothetical protein
MKYWPRIFANGVPESRKTRNEMITNFYKQWPATPPDEKTMDRCYKKIKEIDSSKAV